MLYTSIGRLEACLGLLLLRCVIRVTFRRRAESLVSTEYVE